jgi:aspartate/methionine/tyrosine aminotransferase
LPLDAFCVTGSGMQAIKIAIEAVVDPGRRSHSDLAGLAQLRRSAWHVRRCFGGGAPRLHANGRWSIDPQRMADAITPRTRALFINTPSNPTGWTATREDLLAILALARKHGLWIIADEIYTRFFYAGGRAPSFMDIMDDDDRIIFVNTFSKNWSMTGWRVGWIVAPPSIIQVLENSVQYQTSGVAQFMQKGALAALEHGDAYVESQIAKAATARDLFCDALTSTNRVVTQKPDGAFYAFFRIDGVSDTRAAAIDIVDRAGVGLAPGTAFDKGGASFLRACFLRRLDHVEEAAGRPGRLYLFPVDAGPVCPTQAHRGFMAFLKLEVHPAVVEAPSRNWHDGSGHRRSGIYRQPHGLGAAGCRRGGHRCRPPVHGLRMGRGA